MSEWKECKLGEITSKIGSGATPKGGENSYRPEGISLIRSQNVYDFYFSNNGIAFIDNNQAYELRNVEVFENDILLNITGESVTRCCVVPTQYLPARVNQHVSIIRPMKEKVDYRFIFYSLQSIKPELNTMAEIGCTRRALTKGMLENLEISRPPLPEQRAVASVLSSLDDKIDLLHRQNKTLEAMAETLFRQWFVEEAQEGWEVVKIKDFDVIVTDLVANGSFASLKENVTLVNDKEDYALFIRNTDLKRGFSTKVYVTEHSYYFLKKTRLFGGEVIISSVGNVGSVFRCPKFNIPMTLGNNVIMVKSDFNLFFYLFFKSDYGQGLIYGITSGSVQEKFNKTAFRDLSINYPNIEYIKRFETQVKTYFEKIDFNRSQIHTLEKLRDTLLPKLMSGEVRVKSEQQEADT